MSTPTDEQQNARPWRPRWADHTILSREEENLTVAASQKSLVAESLGLSVPGEQALFRALQLNGMENALLAYAQDAAWQESLPRVTRVDILATQGNMQLKLNPEPENGEEDTDPDRIINIIGKTRLNSIYYVLQIAQPDGSQDTALVKGDLALSDEGDDSCESPVIIVTHESTLNVDELTEILMDAYHTKVEDADWASYSDQEHQARRQFKTQAIRVLQSREAAVKDTLEYHANNFIRGHVPQGWTATIHVNSKGTMYVEVTAPPEAGG